MAPKEWRNLVLSDADLQTGRMPDVCVLTGEGTTALWPVRLGRPSWAYPLLFLAGWIPYLVLRQLLWRHGEVRGRLPMTPGARRSQTWRLVTGWLLIAAGAFVVIAYVPTPFPVGIGVVTSGFGAWLVAQGVRRGLRARVKKGLAPGERWVEIRVHPRFAEARELMFPSRAVIAD